MEQKEEISIQPEQNEETIQKKMRRSLGTSRTTLNIPTSESQGCQKRKRRGRARNRKLISTNNEGELLQSGKGNRLSGIQESQRVPKRLNPR